MLHPEVTLTENELRSWDWPAEAKRQDRGMTWLGRKTDRAATTVRRYSDVHDPLNPPVAWLRVVAQLLGVEVVAE